MYDLITSKGAYPYESCSSVSRLCKKIFLPIDVFYDSLHNCKCITTDYEFAKKNLGQRTKGESKNKNDYCKMYPASDVLTQLHTVCKNTTKLKRNLGSDLDFTFYVDLDYTFYTFLYFIWIILLFNSSSLILKINSEKMGLITDVDQHLVIEIHKRMVSFPYP